MNSIRKILFLLIVSVSISFAQKSGYGFGVMIGEPTGISAKYWFDTETAVSGGLAYSILSGNSKVSLHADYIYHLPGIIDFKNEEIPFYYGFGFRLRTGGSSSLGVRGVTGFVWQRNDYPVDIFLEAAPVFLLLPETKLEVDFALGARYYFK